MNDKFEDFIKQSVDNPPALTFEERMWKDMEGRLNRANAKGRSMGLWTVLPWVLLAFLTTGLAGYFYVKQYKAMERIVAVEQKLAATIVPAEKEMMDRRTVALYDTIYRTVVIDEYVRRQSSFADTDNNLYWNDKLSDSFKRIIENESIIMTPAIIDIQTYALNSNWGIRSKREAVQSNTEAAAKEYSFDWSKAAEEIPALGFNGSLQFNRSLKLPAMEVLRNREKRDVRFYLKNLRPTRFLLSGTTGTFASLNLGGSGFNLRGSAHAELGLGNRFSILAGIEYFSNDFTRRIEIEDVEPLEGFPNLPANNGEDVLTQIQGDFNYLQIPFGVKYVVFPRKVIDTYLGVGFIYGKTTRSRLEYEYLSPIGPYSVSEGRLLPNLFKLNALYGSIGVQIQMNKHWSLLLEGSGQMDIKQGVYKYENLELLKLNTGVLYQF
jgi:hypothetical protein